MGRVFERVGEGHQFNQHYLDNMFPLQPAPLSPPSPSLALVRKETRNWKRMIDWVKRIQDVLWGSKENKGGIGGSGFLGAKEEGNEFMESVLKLGHDGDERSDEREGVEISYLGTHGAPLGKGEREVLLRDMSPVSPKTMRKLRGEFDSRAGVGFTTNGVKKMNGNGMERRNGVSGGVKEREEVIERTEEDVGYGDMGDLEEKKEEQKMEFQVKELSRLWLYINGRSPKPDEVDGCIARMATI